MGAWGYDTYDNDSAMDFVADMVNQKKFNKEVADSIEEKDYNSVRAAADLIIRLEGVCIFDEDVIENVINSLEEMLVDKEWLSDWDNSRQVSQKIVKTAKLMIKKLKKLNY